MLLQMRSISNNVRISPRAALPGRRITAQRRLLLELIGRAQGHLDADELHHRAKEVEPSISLSTVYRNLRLFKNLGLVEERHFAEDHHHYEAKAEIEHHHLMCLGCGSVTEFQSPLIGRLKREVGRDRDFDIADADVQLTGYCPRCRKQRAKDER